MVRDTNRLQNSRVFFFSKSVKKSVKRGVRVLSAKRAREKRLSPVSLSVFNLVPDLSFDCSRVLQYAKIRVSCSLGHKRTQTFMLHKYAL